MKRFTIILIFVFSGLFAGMGIESVYPSANSTQKSLNYIKLKIFYGKWQKGLFGSRKYNERLLIEFLTSIIGKEIATDNSFTLTSPGRVVDKNIKCRFSNCKWLNFHGDIDSKFPDKVIKSNKRALKSWWRSREFLSVSGRLLRFRFSKNRYGDTVELYLDKIVLSL